MDQVDQVNVQNSFAAPRKTGLGAVVVSALVVVFFGATLVFMITRPVDYGRSTDLLDILLGTLAAGFMTVVNYWMGSSAGSKAKDDLLAAIHANRSGG